MQEQGTADRNDTSAGFLAGRNTRVAPFYIEHAIALTLFQRV